MIYNEKKYEMKRKPFIDNILKDYNIPSFKR